MKLTSLAAALFFFTAAQAGAQGAGKACQADIEKFCPDAASGKDGIRNCLSKHEAELSAACRAKGRNAPRSGGGPNEACKSDLEKLCKDVKGGPAEKMTCLKDHSDKLSKDCRDGMSAKKNKSVKEEPCEAEVKQICGDMKSADASFIGCFKERTDDFSEVCRDVFLKRRKEMFKNNPCAADIEKFCKGVSQGGGRIFKCLNKYEDEVTPACKTWYEEMAAQRGGRDGGKGRN